MKSREQKALERVAELEAENASLRDWSKRALELLRRVAGLNIWGYADERLMAEIDALKGE